MSTKANFFIVGAAKSGTTSLYKYLDQHSDIYFSPIKEPNYFSDDIDILKFSETYKRNTFLKTESYFSQEKLKEIPLTFIRSKGNYNRLFDLGKDFKLRGEASTSYLYSTNAAKNIYEYNPNSKIIVILRNPIERTFSHYQMAVRYGFTKLNFREAVEKDMNENEKGWGVSELFVDLSLYYIQLKRYFDVFPKNQIKILFSTDLKNRTQETLSECFNFLGVEEKEIEDQMVYNVSTVPRNIILNHFFTQTGLKKRIKPFVPKFVYQSFYKAEKSRISKQDFDFLAEIYREDIKKTASLLNQDLTSWLKYKTR